MQGATLCNNNSSRVDYVNHHDIRRDLHSEVQGIPVALEPRKKSPRPLTSVGALSATVLKSLRPLTSVGALSASFVSTTAAAIPEDSIGGGTPIGCSYNVKAQTARLSAIDSSDDFIQFCQPPRCRAIIDYVGEGSGGVIACGCFGSIS